MHKTFLVCGKNNITGISNRETFRNSICSNLTITV
nr:MAG TPA: hypothetical protein [Caudoviricetes sp.]